MRNLFSIFFFGVAVMSVYNVFGVGGEVEAMAKETACQGQPLPCTAQYTKAERTPFAHTYKMYTSATSGEKEIVCRRQYIFVGDYSCKGPEGASSADVVPAASASAKANATSSVPLRFPAKAKTPVAPTTAKAQPAGSAGAAEGQPAQ